MKIENPILNQIWKDRYSKNNETIEENLHRVARYCATNEKEEKDFYELMDKGLFFPAGRTISNSGIGTDLTLNNCFNSNHVPDSIDGIFDRVKLGALTHKRGGGIGYDFSLIRPNGTPTSNDAIASGVVSFMQVFNTQTATILQGGRRGANMGILNIYHPDIYEYLEAKSYDEGKLIHFNLSVMVDDKFMEAVKADKDIFLHYPVYDEESHIITDETKWKIKKKVNAKELWDLIMTKAYNTGEYGVFFYDNLNRDNNTWYLETIVSTNPCGEYVSGTLHGKTPIEYEIINPNEYMGACNLGSIFLHNMVENPFTKEAKFNYNLLEDSICKAVRFLDNIIDINKFPHVTYENYQKNMRTIGLGFTGLADTLAMLNLKYGSNEAIRFTDELLNLFAKITYQSSIQLAKEKGSFKFLDRKNFILSGFINKHMSKDKEWINIANDIIKYGIRNARLISIAPTGTLSLTFGQNCSSGLEPIFSLEYDRKVKIGGQSDDNIQIVKMRDYAYNLWLNTPKEINIVDKDIFVTAMDLSVKAHIDMLGIIAFHTDMSCSKTVNIPTDYSFEDTKQVYMDCWEKGIKGCTIFRPNPLRQGIFITNDDKKEDNQEQSISRGEWKDKAKDTIYYERKIYIGCGKLKLFIGWSDEEKCIQDLYVIRSGNGGCERNLQGMVIAMSGMLRLGGNIFNIEKAFEGIGACNSFTSKRVKGENISKGNSCGTAILNEIKAFLKEKDIYGYKEKNAYQLKNKDADENNIKTEQEQKYLNENGEIAYAKKFNKCPICNEELQNAGGCLTCNSCGWTKCE